MRTRSASRRSRESRGSIREDGPGGRRIHHTEDKKGRRVVEGGDSVGSVLRGMIWNLDQNIGRLLEALSECGEEENTVVVSLRDNGGLATSEGSPTCNLPASEGKGWVYEAEPGFR